MEALEILGSITQNFKSAEKSLGDIGRCAENVVCMTWNLRRLFGEQVLEPLRNTSSEYQALKDAADALVLRIFESAGVVDTDRRACMRFFDISPS